jgi:hypothetical protein
MSFGTRNWSPAKQTNPHVNTEACYLDTILVRFAQPTKRVTLICIYNSYVLHTGRVCKYIGRINQIQVETKLNSGNIYLINNKK